MKLLKDSVGTLEINYEWSRSRK